MFSALKSNIYHGNYGPTINFRSGGTNEIEDAWSGSSVAAPANNINRKNENLKNPKDFKRIRIIGRGGVGRVYLVSLKNTDKVYAMKILRQDEMIERNKIKRVLTERQVLSSVNHPLIVNLYYSFQSKSKLYFVMDYCAGGEFYTTIHKQPNRCLKESQMRFYAAEVLLALEYLHAMGFVYRDLKPENILLHANGHIRLTDFDLSKISTSVNVHIVDGSPAPVAEPNLISSSFVGTEEYLAPEIVAGRCYNASVDWWAFGILMYEMLYGFTPFRGRNRSETFCNIQKCRRINFPEHPRCTVSKECKSIIKKLLHYDVRYRLGFLNGSADIKMHPFFLGINWALVLNQVPPIIPKLSDPLDLRYFSSNLVDDDLEDDLYAVNVDELDENHPFKSFGNLNREFETFTGNSNVGECSVVSGSQWQIDRVQLGGSLDFDESQFPEPVSVSTVTQKLVEENHQVPSIPIKRATDTEDCAMDIGSYALEGGPNGHSFEKRYNVGNGNQYCEKRYNVDNGNQYCEKRELVGGNCTEDENGDKKIKMLENLSKMHSNPKQTTQLYRGDKNPMTVGDECPLNIRPDMKYFFDDQSDSDDDEYSIWGDKWRGKKGNMMRDFCSGRNLVGGARLPIGRSDFKKYFSNVPKAPKSPRNSFDDS